MPCLRKKLFITGAVICLILGGWCFYRAFQLRGPPEVAWRALRAPQHMTLYSIDPDRRFGQPIAPGSFHEFRVLGEAVITDQPAQRAVVRAIEDAVCRSGSQKACFDPRHGVRVTTGADTFDFLICFECSKIHVYSGDQFVAETTISDSPQALNALLREAKLPIAAR